MIAAGNYTNCYLSGGYDCGILIDTVSLIFRKQDPENNKKMNNSIKSTKPALIALVLIAFSFTACIDESLLTKNDTSIVVDEFMYATTKTIELDVVVNDTYNSEYFYKVEVFDQNPFTTDTTANLLAAGVAKGNSPFTATLAVPVHVSTLYVRQTDPLQRKTVKTYTIDNVTGKLKCDFGAIVVAASNAKAAKVIAVNAAKATDYPLPATYVTLGSSATTLSGANYYVPAGTTNSDINYGWNPNAALYVAGEVVFTSGANFYMPASCKLVVLPGGKVTFNTAPVFEQSGDIVAVHPGATLTFNQSGGVGVNSKIINDGALNMAAAYEIRTSGQLINNGTLNGLQLTLTNNSQFVNNQKVLFSNAFVMNSNTSFENNGSFEAIETIRTNNTTSVITNNNHLKTNYYDMSSGGGQLINNCSVECEDFAMEGATVTSATGTIILCQDVWMNNTVITLNGNAIFNARRNPNAGNVSNEVHSGVTFNYGVVINGVAQGLNKPLFNIWKINKKNSWMVLKLDGTLEYSLDLGNTPGSNYYNGISAGVSFVEIPTLIIASTDCNGGGINTSPSPVTPTDPTFPIVVKEDNQYTFAMEDLWPRMGDYDMNDIVFKIHNIQKTMNAQNGIMAMSFDITPLAAGSTLKLGAALQFDQIETSNISLKSTNEESYLESNQVNANLILFPDVHKLFGKSTPSITNTYAKAGNTIAQTITYTVSFSTPVSPDKVIIDNMNFYSIVGEINSTDRHEIHLAGFSPSSKVQKATNSYKDENNMVWGIMMPVGNFKYPTESTKISDAYPQFKTWATSKSTEAKDWYLKPSATSGLVYTK